MSGFITFNGAGLTKVTPDSTASLIVTINNKTYTEAFDTNVATTIDNFITSFGKIISQEHDMLTVDGTTTLDLYGSSGATITVNGSGSVAVQTDQTAGKFSLASSLVGLIEPSGVAVQIYGTADCPTAFDWVTVTCIDAEAAADVANELMAALPGLNRSVGSAVQVAGATNSSKQ